MICDPNKLDELTELAQSQLASPLNSPGPSSEIFVSNYIEAYLCCRPELVELANNNPNSESLDILEARIFEQLGIDKDHPAAFITHPEIVRSLTQISEKKGPACGDSNKENTAHLGADPVMLFKGQFIHEAADIHINGAGIDFIFNRSYGNQVIFNGPLGFNWTHNFHVWLRDGDQVIFRSTGDLREEAYTKHPRFGEPISNDFDYWMPPDGIHGIILAENGSYALRQPDGTRHVFQVDPKHSFLHRLAKIEDRFGNYLKLCYDDVNDQLNHIEINHPQRLVQFFYDEEGRICLIRDYTGREWTYGYDSFGDLVSVTTPSTDRYKCGLTVCYEYSSAFQTGNLQHNLTRIIDASGQIYLETEYGDSVGLNDFNRVTRQRQGGGEYRFEYEDIDEIFDVDYPDELRPTKKTILVERNGQAIAHVYNKFGNLLRREQCTIEKGLPRLLVEQYRYDRDANLIASLSPEGVLTQNLFGRKYFINRNPLTPNNELDLDELTWQERQSFGHIFSTVRRSGYSAFPFFTMAEGEWGNFPDLIGGLFPLSISNQAEDIILKMTYEEEFGQLLTVSDPRFTNSANPDELNEHPQHDSTLTRYFYTGPTQLLAKIEYPQAQLPNGQLAPLVVENFTNYDAQGRLLRSINPIGAITELHYFDDPNNVSFGHLQQTIMDVGGLNITLRNEVDELGRVTVVHAPKAVNVADGRFVTLNVYNDLDQLIETIATSPFNFKTKRFYDRNGKLEREEFELKDENGLLELGGLAVSTFCYDEEFNLVEASMGGVDLNEHLFTKHAYDSAGKRVLTILPKENQMRIRYDERQLPIASISGAGSAEAASVRTDYDGDGRVLRTFDARGNSTSFSFDSFGRVIATENALGHITRTDYDKASNITCVRVFEKKDNAYFLMSRSETEYDALNRAIRNSVNRFENPQGPFFNKAALKQAELVSPGPGFLLHTLFFYDAKGRVVKTENPLGRESDVEYDNLDRSVEVTDPLGNITRMQYDLHNNIIRTDQIDRVLVANGTEISKRFFANTSTYDELDRLTSSTDSLGNTSRFFYNSRGNVARQIDALGNEQRRAFDIFNRLTTTTNFLTATGLGPVTPNDQPVSVFQEYDKNSNLTAVVDALGRRTGYQYDELDRRRVVIYPDDSKMLTDYDVDSNVIRTQDNNGLQRFYTVDALSRTTKVEVDAPIGLEIGGATFERYTYDGLNRQTKAENDFAVCNYRYNSLSWPLEETIEFIIDDAPLKTPFYIVRDFDDVGALVELTYPNGRQLQWERDELNRLTKIQNLSNGNDYQGHLNLPPVRSIAEMTYAGQQKNRCVFGNNTSTDYRHDGAGRLIEIAHANANTALLTIQYLFDAVNNVRVRSDVTPNRFRTEHFAYDALYRLSHEVQPTTNESFDLGNFNPSSILLPDPIPNSQPALDLLIGPIALPPVLPTYDYDLVGNRQLERPAVGNDIDYVSNPLDQYTSHDGVNFVHDTNGNLKNDEQRKYIFDSLNRLVKVETVNGPPIMEFWHDASGRRILERQRSTGIITQLIHDGDDIISEYQNGNLFAQYVFDDGIDRPLHIAAEGVEHWYHADLVGSVRLLTDIFGTDRAKYRYLPFGSFDIDIMETDDGNIFNPWRYTSRRFDVDLESYDYRARQYDAKFGRFVQRDPAEMVDGTNLYAYTMNNPLGFADRSGMGRNEKVSDSYFNVIQFAAKTDDSFNMTNPYSVYRAEPEYNNVQEKKPITFQAENEKIQRIPTEVEKAQQTRHEKYLKKNPNLKPINGILPYDEDHAAALREHVGKKRYSDAWKVESKIRTLEEIAFMKHKYSQIRPGRIPLLEKELGAYRREKELKSAKIEPFDWRKERINTGPNQLGIFGIYAPGDHTINFINDVVSFIEPKDDSIGAAFVSTIGAIEAVPIIMIGTPYHMARDMGETIWDLF